MRVRVHVSDAKARISNNNQIGGRFPNSNLTSAERSELTDGRRCEIWLMRAWIIGSPGLIECPPLVMAAVQCDERESVYSERDFNVCTVGYIEFTRARPESQKLAPGGDF